tara:strand:- start:125 stop:2302 length:2178 start_codon:yes stop_codon:yes gene_type:complete
MDKWQTFPVEFSGGLVTNLSPLQQGVNAPGSARILRNYEPSVEGGYRRIEGYAKYDSTIIPAYGFPVVHGAGQSGTTLILGAIHTTPSPADVFTLGGGTVDGAGQTGTSLTVDGLSVRPSANDTFTIAGDAVVYTISSATALSGTDSTLTISPAITADPVDGAVLSFRYTIAASGVSFDTVNNRATLTLTQTLVVHPVNATVVTFLSTSSNYDILGLAVWENQTVVAKNADLYKSAGSGFTKINTGAYGTTLVNGASQSGSSLAMDGITGIPQAGDVFKIAGVDLIYTVTADATISSGGSTVAINPALDSSPADNAAVTFISVSREGATNTRFARYNFNGTEKIAIVDGVNPPALYDDTNFVVLNDAPAAVIGTTHVIEFKNALFFAKGATLSFTGPYLDSTFSASDGAGSINVGAVITGLAVFRSQLIIFTERHIDQLTGNTLSDFSLQPITKDIGCLEGNTIQEIGGDIMFLAIDGLRLLSATERIGDFGLAAVSKAIQPNLTNFIATNTSFTSCVIREKSQYRILGYSDSITQENAQGIIATQYAAQGSAGTGFAETRGIRAIAADSQYNSTVELIIFANDDGYLYKMESGSSFDGENIRTTFATPHLPMQDPRIRKTFYKLFLYTDPEGSVNFDASLKLDFDTQGTVQPTPVTFSNTEGLVGFYGEGIYGVTTFGAKLLKLFDAQIVGSGNAVSFQFESNGTDSPYSLDALTVEYATHDRR